MDGLAFVKPHEGFVDGAMIAAVEDEDLVAAGDRARDAQGKAVGVRRGRRDLPARQAEALDQKLADDGRVLARQHGRQAARSLRRDRRGDGRRRMAEHRARIAEAEVDQAMAVRIGERGAARLGDNEREGQGPIAHPMHRHAVVEAFRALGRECLGERAGRGKRLRLVPEDGLDARAIHAGHGLGQGRHHI